MKRQKDLFPGDSELRWQAASWDAVRASVQTLRTQIETHVRDDIAVNFHTWKTRISKVLITQISFASSVKEVMRNYDPKATIEFVQPTADERADGIVQVVKLLVRNPKIRQPKKPFRIGPRNSLLRQRTYEGP